MASVDIPLRPVRKERGAHLSIISVVGSEARRAERDGAEERAGEGEV